MDDRRFSPKESARLHSTRHRSFRETPVVRKQAQELTDMDLMTTIRRGQNHTGNYYSTRTNLRIQQRIYLQEAHKRGLKGVPHGIPY